MDPSNASSDDEADLEKCIQEGAPRLPRSLSASLSRLLRKARSKLFRPSKPKVRSPRRNDSGEKRAQSKAELLSKRNNSWIEAVGFSPEPVGQKATANPLSSRIPITKNTREYSTNVQNYHLNQLRNLRAAEKPSHSEAPSPASPSLTPEPPKPTSNMSSRTKTYLSSLHSLFSRNYKRRQRPQPKHTFRVKIAGSDEWISHPSILEHRPDLPLFDPKALRDARRHACRRRICVGPFGLSFWTSVVFHLAFWPLVGVKSWVVGWLKRRSTAAEGGNDHVATGPGWIRRWFGKSRWEGMWKGCREVFVQLGYLVLTVLGWPVTIPLLGSILVLWVMWACCYATMMGWRSIWGWYGDFTQRM